MILECRDLSKSFYTKKALNEVSLKLEGGKIYGLLGENGSGKSTVTSIIAGMQAASGGEMIYKGQSWKPGNMVEAQKAGISMVLQEANTIPDCTVAENLLAGRFDEFSKFGFVSMKKANEEAERMLQKFGITNIHVKDSINKLTFEDRKLIEIVRCVSDETEVFVVDETTTALSLEDARFCIS